MPVNTLKLLCSQFFNIILQILFLLLHIHFLYSQVLPPYFFGGDVSFIINVFMAIPFVMCYYNH